MELTSVKHISSLSEGEGGGKARGLQLLQAYGMAIPETFVILENDGDEITGFIGQLPAGNTYAVRSSADGEDGETHSFAGQFSTFLEVEPGLRLAELISACFSSADSGRSSSYTRDRQVQLPARMHVIVQQMIRPQYSGVLFTADPVSKRRDLVTISITVGTGEDLMSGRVSGEEMKIIRHAGVLPRSRILDRKTLEELFSLSLEIEASYGRPADLEWAIDETGKIWWLQLRPITSLSAVHWNELDDRPLSDKSVYTRGNIGEMMPGPVTPLTLSTFGRAIEVGLQDFYLKIGAISGRSEKNLFVHAFYNHLFFDMNALYQSTKRVLLSRKENVDLAVAGEIVEGVQVSREAGYIRSLVNLLSMIRYINSAPKAWKKLKGLHDRFQLECSGNAKACFHQIDKQLSVLVEAYTLHYVTSSQSGSLYATVLNIHTKGKMPERHHQEKVSRLFNNIPEVTGADVLQSLDRLAMLLAGQETIARDFLDAGNEEAVAFLETRGPAEVTEAWKEFLSVHGQRCVREAEMYEQEWRLDPMPVVDGLRTKTRMILSGFSGRINGYATGTTSLSGNGLSPAGRLAVKLLLPKARKAVARREQTKAWSIGIQHQFKLAYRLLAATMVRENMLEDEDLIFFLRHQEIKEMISTGQYSLWNTRAVKRREIFPELQQLSFPDISFGMPVPEEGATAPANAELAGIPVSRGIVEGKVRLVRNMEEARLLKNDEIMVARYTDIGWTPYYGVVAGLVTEIGSPLSHGAVVAREYGLPAVVSMKGAMATLQTGQRIRLDAVRGEVTLLEKEGDSV